MRTFLLVISLSIFFSLVGCSSPDELPTTIDVGSPDLMDVDASDGARPDAATAEGWSEPAECDDIRGKVDDAVSDSGHPGIAVAAAYADERELCIATAGYANAEEMEAWGPRRLFRIGSVTKTFTAAVVFQLVDEGLVSFDDPLEDWVPDTYERVTVEHLITNTSGIVSYNYVGSFDDSKPWTPDELVEWAITHQPELQFEPGSQWEYSNTNWVLLGLIIEAATGNSYDHEVQTRLLDPLDLSDTYVAASGDDNPDIVDAYDEAGANITGAADPSFGWAAGAIVSSPSDLARWATALFGGDVLSPEHRERMVTPTVLTDGTITEYGAGAFVEIDGDDALYGHTGGIGGYLTYMYFWKADRIALVVMVNQLEAELRDLAGYGWAVPLGLDYP